MATAVPRMRDEQRRRVRAFTLSALGGMALLIVAVLVYALVVGFPVSTTARIGAVAPTAQDGRDVLVRATVGGCEELSGIEVRETRTSITLTARAAIPYGTRWDLSCPDVQVSMFHTVRLDTPVGERRVIDGGSDEPVPVLDDPAELLDPHHG